MALPTKPGQRVMLMEGYGEVREGQTGRVTRRLTDWINEHSWGVRLETGELVEVQENHLRLAGD
jgi:hypothetical protein